MRYAARDLLQAAYRSLRQPSVPTPSARAALPCRLALSPALGGAVGGGVRGASGGVGSGVLPAAAAVLCYQPRQQQHHQHHQHHQHCPSHHNQLHYTAQCSQSHVVARSSSSSSSFSSSPSSFSPSFSSHPIFSPAAASAAAPADLLSSHARQSPGPLLPHSPPHSPPHFPPHRPAAMATQAPRGPVQTQPPRGPVHMQQQARLRVYLQSPGVIGDPYRPPPPMPFLASWFTKAGWKRRWVKWSDALKTGYTIAMLRRHNRGYSRHGLYRELAGTYKQINRAIAADDRTALRHLVTESAFTSLKSSLKHRAESGIARVEWHLVGTSEGNSKAVVPSGNKPPLSFKTLQARLISLEKSKPENGFVQLTLEIKSKQRIAAYDKRKKLISGDPDAEVDVKDIWVFERHMLHPELPWRLCGQLVEPPPQADKSGRQNQAVARSCR